MGNGGVARNGDVANALLDTRQGTALDMASLHQSVRMIFWNADTQGEGN